MHVLQVHTTRGQGHAADEAGSVPHKQIFDVDGDGAGLQDNRLASQSGTMGEWVPGVTLPPARPQPQPQPQQQPQPQLPQPQPQLDRTAAPVDLAAASEQAALIRQGFERLAQKYALGSGRGAAQTVAPAAPASAATATTPAEYQATEAGLHFHGAAIHRPTEADFQDEFGAEDGWRQQHPMHWGGSDARRADPHLLGRPLGAHTREMSAQNDQHRLGETLEAHHGCHPAETQAVEPARRQAWSDSDRARRERYGSLGGTLAGLGGLSPGADEMREADAWRQRQQQEALKRALESQMYERRARALRSNSGSIDEGYRPPPHLQGLGDSRGDSESKPHWQVQREPVTKSEPEPAAEPEPEPEPDPDPDPAPEQEPEPEANGYGSQNDIHTGISSPLNSPTARPPQWDHFDYNVANGMPAQAESKYVYSHAHDLFEHRDQCQETRTASPADTGNNVPGTAGAAVDEVDAQLEFVGRRIENLLRASAEEKLAKEITQAARAADESCCDNDADTEEIEEVIAAEADQFSDDEDWLPSPVKPLRVRARPNPFSVEASLGGRPSSFISITSGVNSTLPASLVNDLGVDLGRHSVALESTSRFVDVRACFDDIFQQD